MHSIINLLINYQDKSDSIESKKIKFNAWKKSETPETPPSTPTSSSKYNYNYWNKTEPNNSNPIKISELNVGIWLVIN